MRPTHPTLALAAALALSGCSLGGKAPDFLMTLTAAQQRQAAATQTAAQSEAVTVVVPTVPRELSATRVPVRTGATTVEYLKNAIWVEPPANLFGRLLSESIAATGRVVLDPRQFTFDPGTRLTGQLQSFGLDADRMEAVAVYDAALARGATGVTTRRFEARVPVTVADAANVAPALNQAANQIAAEVAGWVGGGS